MKLTLLRPLFLAALGWIGLTLQGQAQTAYAVADNGLTLIRFDLAMPGVVTTIGNFGGAVSNVDGLDFRPANGLLYGYDTVTNQVVTINLTNATTAFVSTPTTGSSTVNLGMDFNPVADRLRLVNQNDQNLRINVDTGATTVDGTLAYAAGDPHVGANPNIQEAAYTNNDNDPGTGTLLYYLDADLDTLVSTTNPNGGVLNTVGALGVNSSIFYGFDIYTDLFGNNFAYALLDTSGSGSASALYNINLATGAATLVGPLTGPTSVYGLAIAPAVPEGGATAGLLVLGLVAVELARRKLNYRRSA